MSFFKSSEIKKEKAEISEAKKRLDAALDVHEKTQESRTQVHQELATVVERATEMSTESSKCKNDYLAKISSDCLPAVAEDELKEEKAEKKLDETETKLHLPGLGLA
jgi:hypothetical protein